MNFQGFMLDSIGMSLDDRLDACFTITWNKMINSVKKHRTPECVSLSPRPLSSY